MVRLPTLKRLGLPLDHPLPNHLRARIDSIFKLDFFENSVQQKNTGHSYRYNTFLWLLVGVKPTASSLRQMSSKSGSYIGSH